jgi:SAM-dependent methyltransferase
MANVSHDPAYGGAGCLTPEDYARWRSSEVGRITETLEHRLVLELAGDERDLDVLDLGCGDGTYAVELAERGARVHAVDASERMLAAARANASRCGASITFQKGQARALPLPDASVDLVVAVTVLCFIDEIAPVFAEIARVLRPGGELVLGELGRTSTWAVGRRVRGWLGSPLWRHGRFRTASELRRAVQRSGLRVDVLRGAIFFPRHALAARALARLDPHLGRHSTLGAAFIALRAEKPDAV